ncbi:virulence associated lipoprotein (plasmid) [Borreliella tanukii]|uniref:virulence associated lipoprotein n=1 Tax=Borreliella tanukii TaxID=56146 RepID=UPI0026499094|nr:virulence associated lipoprotein [Borreliella tanukii]WKC81190.1 virulence associated lipoprotein [Borreliella tanukii]
MKYNILASILVFLFLNACNPDFNTNQKDIKHQSSKKGLRSNRKRPKSKKGLTPKTEAKPNQEVDKNQEAKPNQEVDKNQEAKPNQEVDKNQEAKSNQEIGQNQEEDPNKKIKNTLLDDLKNLIEKANEDRKKYEKKSAEETEDQYGIAAFKELGWPSPGGEKVADNTERSNRYRKRTYATLNDIDISELKTLTEIIMLSGQTQGLFNTLSAFGGTLDDVIVHLYTKKDALDKLEILNLENLKNSFEEFLSIKTIVSKILNQLLLDYQNNENSIKKDQAKLESHVATLYNQILEKSEGVEKLKNDIFSIHNL